MRVVVVLLASALLSVTAADAQGRPEAVELFLAQADFAGNSRTFVIPVDPTLIRVVFEIGGANPDLVIRRPDGSVVAASDPDVRVTDEAERITYVIDALPTGLWEMRANGSGLLTVSVTGLGRIDIEKLEFLEARGRPGHEGLFPIAGEPVASQSNLLHVALSPGYDTAQFELRGLDGTVIGPVTLARGADDTANDFVGDIVLPAVPFVVYVAGVTPSGTAYQRMWSIASRPTGVVVRPPPNRALIPGQQSTTVFRVTNLGPTETFTASVTSGGTFVTNLAPQNVTLATGEATDITLTIVVPLSTPPGTLDRIVLTAVGTAGSRNAASVTNKVVEPAASRIPNLAGLTVSAARAALDAAGFVFSGLTTVVRNDLLAGRVVSQDPGADTVATANAAVSVVLSAREGVVTVPNLTGMAVSNAQNAVMDAGLWVGAVTQDWSDTAPPRTVISQTPNAFAGVPASSLVSFVLACRSSVSMPSGPISSSGGIVNVGVSVIGDCPWGIQINDPWITPSLASATPELITIALQVAPNTGTVARSTEVVVAGKTFTVTQEGTAPACAISLGANAISAPADGGTGTLSILATAPGCTWSATSNAVWLTVTSAASGTGNGAIDYAVATSTTVLQRSGALTIGGQTFTVTQAGVVGAVTLSPLSVTVPAAGGTGSVTVDANAVDYTWAVSSNAGWLHVTSGTSGTGNGVVNWTADSHTGSASRSAAIAIGQQTFAVTQSGTASAPLLFMTNLNGQMAVIDSTTRTTVAYVPTPGGFTHGVTVSPDGEQAWAAANFADSIVVAGTAGNVITTIPSPGRPRAVAFHPDGTRAYVVDEAGFVRVINAANFSVIKSVDVDQFLEYAQFGFRPWFMSIAMAPDGGHAFLADVGGALVVYDTATDTPIRRIALDQGFHSVQWVTLTPDGTKALLTDVSQTGLWVIDTATYEIVNRIALGGSPRGVTVLPDGSRAYVANENGYVSIVDLATMTVLTTVPIDFSGARGIVADPDGTRVFATTPRRIATIDVGSNAVVHSEWVGECCGVQLAIQQPRPPLRLAGAVLTTSAHNGTGAVDVLTLTGDVVWSATSSQSWLTITSGQLGTGNGTVQFSIAENRTGLQRSAVIRVGGRAFTVIQQEGRFTITTIGGRRLQARAMANTLTLHASAVATDLSGNLYVGASTRAVFRVSPTGVATRVAGTGLDGSDGDGGPAADAALTTVGGLAVDAQGNVYISDTWMFRVRKVSAATGNISTVAGGNGYGASGDGGSATGARLSFAKALAVDASANLYIADTANFRIRRVAAADGRISTIAGSGSPGFSGDGSNAVFAQIGEVTGIAVDAAGNVYFSERTTHRVRRVSTTGIISTVAGNGSPGGPSSDGLVATEASLSYPSAVSVDTDGAVHVLEGSRLRRINPATNRLETVAGAGPYGFAGDGGPAVAAHLASPGSLAIDAGGNMLIGEQNLMRVRKVTRTTGVISTVVGGAVSGDGGPPTVVSLNEPSVAADQDGNIYVAELFGHRVRKIDAVSGVISTMIGNGVASGGGDGGPGSAASVSYPGAVAVDRNGNLLVAESSRIRRVARDTGIVTKVGGGDAGYAGDGGLASNARFGWSLGLAVDGLNNLYVADADNARIRKISASTGVVTSIGGNGTPGYSGDGGLAIHAQIRPTKQIAVDLAGNVFIGDFENGRIRRIDNATGVITTIAGTGVQGFNGDGAPATSKQLGWNTALAVDPNGVLYIADAGNNRVRKIENGAISTIAGTGQRGWSGDAGEANAAHLNVPQSIALIANGGVIVADSGNGVVRQLAPPLSALTCSPHVDVPQTALPSAGATVTVSVTSAAGCAWSASSSVSWMDFSTASGTATGSITFVASSYAGFGLRVGMITIAGQTFSIAQEGTPCEAHGCAYTFSDNPLIAGVTVVRAIHVTEIREAIDQLRIRAGLPAFGWTSLAGIIRAAHITEMRTALANVYVAAGRAAPVYSEPSIVIGLTPIRASHLQELRAAIAAAP